MNEKYDNIQKFISFNQKNELEQVIQKQIRKNMLIDQEVSIQSGKSIQAYLIPKIKQSLNPQKYSKSLFQILPIILTFCLASFYFGYGVTYLGALNIGPIKNYYKLNMSNSLAEGLLNGMTALGGGIGCLLASPLLNRTSRRNSILIVNLVALTAGALIYIPSDIILFLMRIIQGNCVGLFCTIIPMCIRQLSPTHLAGSLGTLVQLFMAAGNLTTYIFSYLLTLILDDYNKEKTWYYVFGFTQITIIIQIILLVFIYPFQTPKYLILNGKQNEAKQLLTYLYKKQHIDFVYENLKEDFLQSSHAIIEKQLKNQQFPTSQIKTINGRKTPKMAIFTAFFMSFSQQMVGSIAVAIYGGNIVGQILPHLKNQAGIIINSPQLVSTFILSYLLSKYSHKNILQIGMLGLTLVNLMIGIAFFFHKESEDNGQFPASSYLILVGQFIYNFVYGVSVGSMLWVILPAIVQPNIVPFASFMNWLSSATVAIVFPILKQQLPGSNPAYLFIFFAVYTFIAFLLYFKIVIQTKDKSQKQIYGEYQQMKCL